MLRINKFSKLLIILLFLSLIGPILSTINDPNINYFPNYEDEEKKFPYIDDGCKFTKLEVINRVNRLNQIYDSNISIAFYKHPTHIFCHGKPVISNGNNLLIENESEQEVAIGVGVNTDIDNFEMISRYLLFFSFLCLLFSRFQIKKNVMRSLYKKEILILLSILLLYSYFIFPTVISAVTNFLLAIFAGNILFYYISEHFEFKSILKSTIAMSIFPLFFNNSNVTFFWLLIYYCLVNIKLREIKISKNLYLFYAVFLVSFIANVGSYFFSKEANFYSLSLFTDPRHQGGLANINNGFQSLAFYVDIVIISLIIYVLFQLITSEDLENIFYDGLIIGFLIWFSCFFIAYISPFTEFYVYKQFGLIGRIDYFDSPHPDGLNWHGLTPSHELTGFWLAIIASICLLRYFLTNKYKYIPLFGLSLIALSLNSQRSALVIFIINLLFLLIKFKKGNSKKAVLVMLLTIFILSVFNQGVERLAKRFENVDYSTNVTQKYIEGFENTYERYDKYNLDFLTQPNKDILTNSSLESIYSNVLGTENSFIIKPVLFFSNTLKRDLQWTRFLHFNDLDGSNLFFGKGPAQSYEVLDVLLEKPHSLYLTIFYQYGVIGLIMFALVLFNACKRFLKSDFKFIHLIVILIFINGIKSEFLFTHNQIVLFLLFVIASMRVAKK